MVMVRDKLANVWPGRWLVKQQRYTTHQYIIDVYWLAPQDDILISYLLMEIHVGQIDIKWVTIPQSLKI